MDLTVTPVRGKVEPKYPTREYLTEHPELLAMVPERWRRNPLVLKVLGGVVGLMLAGQQAASAQSSAPVRPVLPSNPTPYESHVAGNFSAGPMTTNFLPEDVARRIILDEAKKAGVEFSADAASARGATTPVADRAWCPTVDLITGKRVRGIPSPGPAFVLDGFDPQRNVAFEFVSRSKDAPSRSKGFHCDHLRTPTATSPVAGAASQTGSSPDAAPWVGEFYDWGTVHRSLWAAPADPEELREQVRDFLQWLKAQGVI